MSDESLSERSAESAFPRTVKVTCKGKSGVQFKEFTVRGGLNLWVFLRKNGVPIGAACSGVGVCAACNVRVSPANNVTAANDFERSSLVSHGHDADAERLACLCRLLGDITVTADYW